MINGVGVREVVTGLVAVTSRCTDEAFCDTASSWLCHAFPTDLLSALAAEQRRQSGPHLVDHLGCAVPEFFGAAQSPALRLGCLAITNGIRTARLFPHFETVVSFRIGIYFEYTSDTGALHPRTPTRTAG